MGFLDFLKKNNARKEYLLQWQNVIMKDSPNELIMSEQQLKAFSQQQAANDLRIINDCGTLIETTVNPDVFFMRLNLLMEKTEHLVRLETFIKFIGEQPSDAY